MLKPKQPWPWKRTPVPPDLCDGFNIAKGRLPVASGSFNAARANATTIANVQRLNRGNVYDLYLAAVDSLSNQQKTAAVIP